jgi:membrane-bound lytic murein transglycosylase D
MTMKVHTRFAAACLAGLAGVASTAWAGPLEANRKLIITDESFTADKYILDQACIMVELYYRMDEDEGLLYDHEAPEVVFGRIPLRNLNAKLAEDSLAKARESLKHRVRSLASAAETDWTGEQQALRKMFPADWSAQDIAASSDRIVGHRGMRRTFRSGMETYLQYRDQMDSAFRAEGVPNRLKFLAHVESRYNPEAVSPAGAAGMWQFLKSSGSMYMVIDDRIDERFDPRASTIAAAKFLKLCRKYLGSWPLAIMSYNNGPGQMLDAVKETGSRDPSEIIQKYQAGGFGRVSRNYYAMFLAASSLGMQADKLFPGMTAPKASAQAFKTLKLEHEWTPRQLRILSGYSTAVLRRYNPALRPAIFERNLPVPKGFELKLPAGLPTVQDLQFSDLRIAGETSESPRAARGAMAGFPVPKFAENVLMRVGKTLFARQQRRDQPVMAFMHSQGLLDAERLALAKEDRILIEPHPALHAMILGMGG